MNTASRKRSILSIVILVIAAFLCAPVNAQSSDARITFGSGDVVVSDYGVIGDGKTDVTEALQRIARSLDSHPGFRMQQNWGGATALGSFPKVIFPEGEYVISRPIIWPSCTVIVGEGRVVIRQMRADQDAFYFHWGWRLRLFNLQFEGGKRQVKIWGNNTDGIILIAGCRFSNAAEWAIENVMYEPKQGSPAGGYLRDETKQLQQTENPEGPYYNNSALMNIERCEFVNCKGVLHANTDWTRVQDSRIAADDSMGETAIRNGGFLQLRRVKLEFTGHPSRPRTWAENLGSTLHFTEVSSEGAPISLVKNRRRFRIAQNGTFPTISISNGRFNLGGKGDVPLVICEELPNLLSIRESVSLEGKAPAVSFPVEEALYELPGAPVAQLKIVFDSESKNLNTDVPIAVSPFVYHHQGQKAPAWQWPGVTPDGETLAREAEWMQKRGRVIAPPPGLHDHTTWLQAAVDRESQEAGGDIPRLIIAPGVYRFNGTIRLPSRFRLEASGMALWKMTEPGAPALSIPNPKEVSVSSIIFEGGTNTASIDVKASDEGQVNFFYCFFMFGQGSAIRAKVSGGEVDLSRLTRLTVDHCYLGSSYTFVTSDLPTLIESSYVYTRILTPSMDRGFSGGVFWANAPMVLRNLLMVPVLEHRNFNYPWVVSGDGRVEMDSLRFGGEGGGISVVTVLSQAPHAEVSIRRSAVYTLNNAVTKSAVFLDRTPEAVVVEDNMGLQLEFPERVFLRLGASVKDADDVNRWFFRSANNFHTRVARGKDLLESESELN